MRNWFKKSFTVALSPRLLVGQYQSEKFFHIYFWPHGGPINRILWHLWLIFSRCIFVAAFIIISFIFIYIQFLIRTILIFRCLKIKILVDCIVRITKVLLFSLSLAFFTDLRNFSHRKASKNVFLLIRSMRHFPEFSRYYFYRKSEIENFRKTQKFDGIGLVWLQMKAKFLHVTIWHFAILRGVYFPRYMHWNRILHEWGCNEISVQLNYWTHEGALGKSGFIHLPQQQDVATDLSSLVRAVFNWLLKNQKQSNYCNQSQQGKIKRTWCDWFWFCVSLVGKKLVQVF